MDNGWKPAQNDVKKLTDGYLDIFGDVSERNQADVIERLVGLYAGNIEAKLLPRARNDLSSAVLLATGPWKGKKELDVTKDTGVKIGEIYNNYNYTMIDAAAVLRDFGITTKGDPVKVLRSVLKPLPIPDLPLEDPRIGALLVGLPINRYEYDLIYSFLARRIQVPREKQK